MQRFSLTSTLLLVSALLGSRHALAQDDLGSKFNQALKVMGRSPHAQIQGPGGEIGSMGDLNTSELRSRIIGDELFTTSQLLIDGTANPTPDAQLAVCRSTKKGLNLIVGTEILEGYGSLVNEIGQFREIFWSIRSILECDGSTETNTSRIHLQNVRSQQYCLNLNHSNDGQPNNVYPCNIHNDQVWSLEYVDGPYVRVRNEGHGKCLNIQGPDEGKATDVFGCEQHPDQQWLVIRHGDGTIQLQNRNYGKCLSLDNANVNAPTQIHNCNASDPSQNWKLIR